jgi:hypothetical protein
MPCAHHPELLAQACGIPRRALGSNVQHGYSFAAVMAALALTVSAMRPS